MASDSERAAMRRAVEIAARGLGTTSPNPVVGAVVLDASGAVVGEGWHDRPGGPHAEVAALAAAGAGAAGGTVVTTLEPCRSVGRVGACTDALLAAGVRRVVYAVADPTAGNAGGGDVLRAAGLDVEGDVEGPVAARGNEAWLACIARGRPFVTVKLATSVDGRVAANDGSSRWITSPEARADGHRLRATSDAVVAGIRTVLADDPHLTARDSAGDLLPHQPLRVVVDSQARLPLDARVLDGLAPTLVATTSAADEAAVRALADKADVVVLPAAEDGHTSVPALLAELAARDVVSLLVEGGPILVGAFIDQGLADRLVAYVAPAVLGGDGAAAVAGLGSASIADIRRYRLDAVERVGPDVRLELRPETSA